MTITITGVGHAVLTVRTLRRSVPFYVDGLGLREVARGDFGEGPMVFLSTGRTHHDLALVELGDDSSRAPARAVGLHHLAFRIGDDLDTLRRARDHLRSLGIPVHRVLDHRVSTGLYLSDPDDHLIELYVDTDPAIWQADPAIVATSTPLAI